MPSPDPRDLLAAALGGALAGAHRAGIATVEVRRSAPLSPRPPARTMPPPATPPAVVTEAAALRAMWDATSPEARRLFLADLARAADHSL